MDNVIKTLGLNIRQNKNIYFLIATVAFVCVLDLSGRKGTTNDTPNDTIHWIACSECTNNGNNLCLDYHNEFLYICGEYSTKVHYIEAFVRSGSSNQDWEISVIKDSTTLVDKAEDGSWLHLRSILSKSESDPPIIIDHHITASTDEVTFLLTAHNPSNTFVDVLWAEPCIRVAGFTGRPEIWLGDHYLDVSFIFLDDTLTTLDETPPTDVGFYDLGQVFAPAEINRDDLNPRPLSPAIPSNGLIGCYSKDRSMLLATAWQPYQELFQGVITCLHSDFRIGGLNPGQTKTIKGKIYIMENNIEKLLQRYQSDFGE